MMNLILTLDAYAKVIEAGKGLADVSEDLMNNSTMAAQRFRSEQYGHLTPWFLDSLEASIQKMANEINSFLDILESIPQGLKEEK